MSSIQNQKKNAIRSTSSYESKLSNEQQQTKRTIVGLIRVRDNSGRERRDNEQGENNLTYPINICIILF